MSHCARTPDNRAQQEVICVSLLTGIVVIVALSVGAVVVAQSSGDEAGPRTDLRAPANDTHLALAHNGGDSL